VRRKESGSQAAAVGDVVKNIFLALQTKSEIGEDRLLLIWLEAVGEMGAKNSKPVSLNNGVLSVIVKNSSWSQELSLKKRWVIKKLQTAFGKDLIHDIRFKTGSI
jgi:predicted nucleic acid-binding Zn ribbon protein